MAFRSVWGLVAGTFTLLLASLSIAMVTAPLGGWLLPGRATRWLWGGHPSSVGWALLAFVVGSLGVLVAPLTARGLILLDVQTTRLLLTPRPDADQLDRLSQRVRTLTRTRAATVDSVEAERRRIERDLHDGPQQRLVAIAIDLGLAQQRLARNPESARELLDKAHRAAKEAVVEMRQVARGVHPPILTDRGLDAALSALAATSAVPVTVEVLLPSRPSPTLEAIAYFCASEGLTNVAKHAGASSARVAVSTVTGWLQIEISDDGVGGARTDGPGTGLRGLADRAAAVDGVVELVSPAGGPTVLTVRLPLRSSDLPDRRATGAPGARS